MGDDYHTMSSVDEFLINVSDCWSWMYGAMLRNVEA